MPQNQSTADLLQNVNPSQQEAIQHLEGPLLVLAGAGSGKTRVVTRRIAWLLTQGVRPNNILALTFTNKAAGEMRRRVEQLTSHQGIWVSTFHSTGARLLRRYINRLGRDSGFTIFDSDDKAKLIKQAVSALELDPKQWTPGMLGGPISNAKNGLKSVEEFTEEKEHDFYGQTVAKIYGKYEELLEKNNGLDFDDLLVKLLQVLVDHEDVLVKLQNRFKFILIDEYQDTNRAQYSIAQLLSAAHRNLHVTGDPDQSIYSWRGADIRNILDFEKDYSETRVVKLEQNYRSTKNILAAANGMIRHNQKRKDKDLWTENADGDLTRLSFCEDEQDEAMRVATRIEVLRQNGFKLTEMAIFYRTNAQSRVIEQALIETGTNYVVVGGVAFYERKEVKDILAYVRCVVNPRDDISVERIINVPVRSIGKTTIQAVKVFSIRQGIPLLDAVRRAAEIPSVKPRAQKALEGFLDLYDKFVALPPSPAAEVFRKIIDETNYEVALGKSTDNADDRIANVRELISAAEIYDEGHPDGDVRGFLEQSALVSDLDSWDRESEAVTMMTLHLAKGLEFPVVFIVGVEAGMLPHANSVDSDIGYEEERRLFYVGMTRAMKLLNISCAQERRQFGEFRMNEPSPFLDEIPEALLQKESFEIHAGYDGKKEPYYVMDDEEDYYVGEIIRHHHFGLGTILDIEHGRNGATLKVRFQRSGVKRLDPEVAHLERLS